MNFAFPALLILLLSLPGIFFRFGYKNGFNTHIYGADGFGEISIEIAKGILVAGLLHAVAIKLLPHIYWALPANLNVVFTLMSGSDIKHLHCAIDNVSGHFGYITTYFITTSLTGFVLGIICRRIITGNFIDVYFATFRMENPWEYFFSGKNFALEVVKSAFDQAELEKLGKNRSLIRANQKKPKTENGNAAIIISFAISVLLWPFKFLDPIVKYFSFFYQQTIPAYLRLRFLLKGGVTCYASFRVEASDKDILIIGIVSDYDYDENGELNKIILEDTSRMELVATAIPKTIDILNAFADPDGPESKAVLRDPSLRHVKIPGDRFLVRYNTVQNMNAVWVYKETSKATQKDIEDDKKSSDASSSQPLKMKANQ